MTRKRFEQLTKELLETCKEELNGTIEMDCDINNWEDLIDGFTVDQISNLQEVAYSVSNVEDSLEDGEFSLGDIKKVYDFVHLSHVNIDEQIEYLAIVNELKELED